MLIPWASLGIESYLTKLIGMMPSSKLLYSSDQVYEPELFWLPAPAPRAGPSNEAPSARRQTPNTLTPAAAHAIGRGILAGNTRRLHGLEAPI